MNRLVKGLALTGVGATVVLSLAACPGSDNKNNNEAKNNAMQNAQSNVVYNPVNKIEQKNYNSRTRLADNPASLIWCTVYPSNMNAKPFTIPIVGKLTSGNKRPIPNQITRIDTDTPGSDYNPELPGPDGMYGTSGEYRYGFDPAGNYHEFYTIGTYCTSVPNTYQKNQTEIVVKVQSDLSTVDKQVEAALAKCQGNNQVAADPTKPCPAAADILGVN